MNNIWKLLIVLALLVASFNFAMLFRRDSVRRAVEAELAARELRFVNRVKGKVNDVRVALGSSAVSITNLEELAEAYLGAMKSITTEPPVTPK